MVSTTSQKSASPVIVQSISRSDEIWDAIYPIHFPGLPTCWICTVLLVTLAPISGSSRIFVSPASSLRALSSKGSAILLFFDFFEPFPPTFPPTFPPPLFP